MSGTGTGTGTTPRSSTGAGGPTEATTGLVNRIDWEPGSDLLRGTCHCGARHVCADPMEMWDWLLSHPAGHRPEESDG